MYREYSKLSMNMLRHPMIPPSAFDPLFLHGGHHTKKLLCTAAASPVAAEGVIFSEEDGLHITQVDRADAKNDLFVSRVHLELTGVHPIIQADPRDRPATA